MARSELLGISVLVIAGTIAVIQARPAPAPAVERAASLEQIPTGWQQAPAPGVRDVTVTPRLAAQPVQAERAPEPAARIERAALTSSAQVVSPIPEQKRGPLCTTFRTYNPDTGTYRAYDGSVRTCLAR